MELWCWNSLYVKFLLPAHSCGCVLKSGQCHFRLCNLNAAFWVGLFATFSKSSSLRRHDWFPRLNLFEFCFSQNFFSFCQWNFRNAQSSGLLNSSFECLIVDLLIKWWMVAAFRIDIVCKQVMPVIDSSYCWIDVSFTICMEGWFAKVGSEGRIRKPSSRVVELRAPLFHLLLGFLLGWSQDLLGHGLLRGFALHVCSNFHLLSIHVAWIVVPRW